jgi:hypothetical protein
MRRHAHYPSKYTDTVIDINTAAAAAVEAQ